MDDQKITIDANVGVSVEDAWEYYTSPEHIVHWNFASDDWCCPSAENDMRVGGTYKARMEAKDGSFGFDFEGVYEEVLAPETFTYKLGDGRMVIVNFKAEGASTHVEVEFDAETQNPIEMQRGGWQSILNNYKKYAEGQG